MIRTFLLFIGLAACGSAAAQFELERFRIAGGGGSSEGGAWSLTGTIGQSEADVIPLCSNDGDVPGLCQGASISLSGGFWIAFMPSEPHPGCIGRPDCVFLDGFEDSP